MKFYSEVTKELYDTEKQLIEAEESYNKQNKELTEKMEKDEAELIERLHKLTKFMKEVCCEIEKNHDKLFEEYNDFVERYECKPKKFNKEYEKVCRELFDEEGEGDNVNKEKSVLNKLSEIEGLGFLLELLDI